MLNMFYYSHITAKIHGMKGKMLTKENYQQLLQQKTVKDAALYLKSKTYYKDVLKTLDENDVHRGYLEILLRRSLVNDELKIVRYLKGTEKKTYRYVYRKQEIEDIKRMLRFLQMGKSIETIDRNLFFISKYSVIDFERLFKVKNIRELLEGLNGTNFYKILKPLIIDDDHIDLFSAEMALDMYYYKKLNEEFNTTIRGKNRMILKNMFGIEADTKNILWIYRSKKYYNISKEIIYRYLIPYHYRLNKKIINKMVESSTIKEFLTYVSQTKYAFDVEEDSIKKENTLLIAQIKDYKKYMKYEPFSIAPIACYIFIKEVEIANITTIIEGVRYNVSPSEIQQMVIS